MSITLVLPSVFSIVVSDDDADANFTAPASAATLQLNALLRRLGLHLFSASTQLHIMPEKVHVVSPEDIALLSQHARVLVTSKDVQCDFGVLCGVLWGHVKDGENVVDSYLHQPDDMTARRLLPTLFALAQLFHILRHIEEPFARKEVRGAVKIVQKDVEMAVRLGVKLSSVLDISLKGAHRGEGIFLRGAEVCFSAIGMYTATIATRCAIDVNPILSFLKTETTWRLSGAGIVATECYCEAIRRLICAIFAREHDFAGVQRVAALLLLKRLADRPPFDWDTFQHLYWPRSEPITPQYGVLRCMSVVQHCVESLLLSKELWAPALKREINHELRNLNEKKMMLSFFQVPVLAASQGMPDVDLSDDVQLQRRAVATHLSSNDHVLQPNLLRILLAHGYTVRDVSHSTLGRTSALSLLRAIIDQIFQVPLIQSRETAKMNEKLLQLPILTSRIFGLIIQVTSFDAEAADDVLREIRQVVQLFYDAGTSQTTSLLSPEKMLARLQHVSVLAMELLFTFFESKSPLIVSDRRMALETFARVFAVRAMYFSGEDSTKVLNATLAAHTMQRMIARLAYLGQTLTPPQITAFLEDVIVPCSAVEEMRRKSRQHHALLEGYVRSLASAGVALVVEEKAMLRHWVDVSLRCITNFLSGSLATAGLDFLSAVFLSKRTIAPLFVPTYVALFITISNPPRYGEPPLFLVRRFSRTVRASCQALEECDERALLTALQTSNSPLRAFLSDVCGEGRMTSSMENIRPISCVLLIVSALFDKVCLLLGYTTTTSTSTAKQGRFARFQAYFSALINLLQCRSSTVLHRVCASVEAVILEHLRGVPHVQARWMKYIASTVDSITGISKTVVAEWLLMLNDKVKNVIVQAKL